MSDVKNKTNTDMQMTQHNC